MLCQKMLPRLTVGTNVFFIFALNMSLMCDWVVLYSTERPLLQLKYFGHVSLFDASFIQVVLYEYV